MEKIPVSKGDVAEGSVAEHALLDAAEPPEPDVLTTGVRLIVGATSLGLEAFGSRLRAWGQQRSHVEPVVEAEEREPDAGSMAEAIVGVAARGARTVFGMGSRGTDLALQGLRAAEGASEAVGRVMPGFVTEPLTRVRRRAGERISRFGAVGRDEIERSKAIARAAIDEGLDTLFTKVAESRELQFVIRTQSTSAAEEAVDSIRDQTSRIDDRLEGAARRILRRPPKPPPAPPR